MRETLKLKLYEAVKNAYPNMLRKDEAKDLCESLGFEWGDNGTSRLRELRRAGLIDIIKEVVEVKGRKTVVVFGYLYQKKEIKKFEVKVAPKQDSINFGLRAY